MPKKPITKKELIQQIEEKVQALQLLQSVVKEERSRKPEVLENYRRHFEDLCGK